MRSLRPRTARITSGALLGVALLGLVAAGVAARAPRPPLAALVPALQDAAAPTGPVAAGGCVTPACHANVKRHDRLHGPVTVDACDACHTPVSAPEHTFRLAREGLELCTFCHDVAVDAGQTIHAPLQTGDCTACHEPHGGPDRQLLRAPTASELCGQCHVDVVGSNRVVHGPVAAGACAACHSPHASPYPYLLSAEGPELCTSCHVTTKTQLATMRTIHGPVASDCRVCHDAHASDHAMMLRSDPQTLCLECHESIRHTIDTAQTKHAAVTNERTCLNCHEPHASDFPSVLRTDMLTLCFECHDREIPMPEGRALANIKSVIETGTSLHGPVAQHNCAACHQIHGGNKFRLLFKEYPPEFYAPFKEESYALCFSCHERHLVRDAATTTLTNFRNGDTNLHYLHVNKEKKGRTCRACHETHASRQARHVREAVPFGTGGWMLPINFAKTDTGGRCAPGCHVAYGYDRVTPEAYPSSGSPATWPSPDDPGPPSLPEGDEP